MARNWKNTDYDAITRNIIREPIAVEEKALKSKKQLSTSGEEPCECKLGISPRQGMSIDESTVSSRRQFLTAAAAPGAFEFSVQVDPTKEPGRLTHDDGGLYGFGSTSSADEVAMIDFDVMQDGRGAPPGSGTYEEGKMVYSVHCIACHEASLEGNSDLGGAALIGGRGSLTSDPPKKTIKSYWPYASTVFDYVERAMPFQTPCSLSDDDVYRVTAYTHSEANTFDKSATLNAESLAAIEMPKKDGIIPDPRPNIFNYE